MAEATTRTRPARLERAELGPALTWLMGRAELDDDAWNAVKAVAPAALTRGAADPAVLLRALLDAGLAAEALRVIACALPPREGIWWAFVAARHSAQMIAARPDHDGEGDATAKQADLLALIERWINQPTDENRRAAWALAQDVGLETPSGCTAAAIFFSGGSLTPAGSAYVPPPAGVHVTMAATAVLLAAALGAPDRLVELADAFTGQGIAIVRQLGSWEASLLGAKRSFDQQVEAAARAQTPPAQSARA
jgi:hypothetical protein